MISAKKYLNENDLKKLRENNILTQREFGYIVDSFLVVEDIETHQKRTLSVSNIPFVLESNKQILLD